MQLFLIYQEHLIFIIIRTAYKAEGKDRIKSIATTLIKK